MDLSNYFEIDSIIKAISSKYRLSQRAVKLILTFEICQTDILQTDTFIQFLFIDKQNLQYVINELLQKGFIVRDENKKPFNYSLTQKGLQANKAFLKEYKRNIKTIQ